MISLVWLRENFNLGIGERIHAKNLIGQAKRHVASSKDLKPWKLKVPTVTSVGVTVGEY